MKREIRDCVAACDRFNAFLSGHREAMQENMPSGGEKEGMNKGVKDCLAACNKFSAFLSGYREAMSKE